MPDHSSSLCKLGVSSLVNYVTLTVEDLKEIFSFNEKQNDAEDREEPEKVISEDKAIMEGLFALKTCPKTDSPHPTP